MPRPSCDPVRQADTFTEDYDVVLIGGGVAGYVAAIKAGQEGMKVGISARSQLRAATEIPASRSHASRKEGR
jgi:thioredoxin reductase